MKTETKNIKKGQIGQNEIARYKALKKLEKRVFNYFEKFDDQIGIDHYPTKNGLLKHLNLSVVEFEELRKNNKYSNALNNGLFILDEWLKDFLIDPNVKGMPRKENNQLILNVLDEMVTSFEDYDFKAVILTKSDCEMNRGNYDKANTIH